MSFRINGNTNSFNFPGVPSAAGQSNAADLLGYTPFNQNDNHADLIYDLSVLGTKFGTQTEGTSDRFYNYMDDRADAIGKRQVQVQQMGVDNIQSSITSRIQSMFSNALSLAKQNRKAEAQAILNGAASVVDFGSGSLAGSDVNLVDTGILSGVKGQFSSLLDSASQIRGQVEGTEISDAELLQTTGHDKQGRTMAEILLEQLKQK